MHSDVHGDPRIAWFAVPADRPTRRCEPKGETMRCPYCRHPDSRVVDSREAEDGQLIRRRRSCPECGRRFTTVEEAVLAVVKRSGVTEPFSRTKIISGVRKACQGRPVDDDALALLAQRVEEAVRARGAAEVPSHDVGLAILGPLRELDEVAYLRFASVYRSFESLDDFEREISTLRAEREPTAGTEAPAAGSGGRTVSERTTTGRAFAGRDGAERPPGRPVAAAGTG
jgi:transcriptional repressor NrdR